MSVTGYIMSYWSCTYTVAIVSAKVACVVLLSPFLAGLAVGLSTASA